MSQPMAPCSGIAAPVTVTRVECPSYFLLNCGKRGRLGPTPQPVSLALRPALRLSPELRRRRWGGVWSPLLPLGGWGGFMGLGWALTTHILSWVMEGLSCLLSTPWRGSHPSIWGMSSTQPAPGS